MAEHHQPQPWHRSALWAFALGNIIGGLALVVVGGLWHNWLVIVIVIGALAFAGGCVVQGELNREA